MTEVTLFKGMLCILIVTLNCKDVGLQPPSSTRHPEAPGRSALFTSQPHSNHYCIKLKKNVGSAVEPILYDWML